MKRDTISATCSPEVADFIDPGGALARAGLLKVKGPLTLREACIARGIDPENTGYKVPRQRVTALDRIIPGVPDHKAPSQHPLYASARVVNPRNMYSRGAAETHRTMIAEGGTAAYVALFNQLNHLKEVA